MADPILPEHERRLELATRVACAMLSSEYWSKVLGEIIKEQKPVDVHLAAMSVSIADALIKAATDAR